MFVVRQQQVCIVCMAFQYANANMPVVCVLAQSLGQCLAFDHCYRLPSPSLLLRTLRLSLIVVYASICFTIILSTIMSSSGSQFSTWVNAHLYTFLHFHSLFRLPFHSHFIAICRPQCRLALTILGNH